MKSDSPQKLQAGLLTHAQGFSNASPEQRYAGFQPLLQPLEVALRHALGQLKFISVGRQIYAPNHATIPLDAGMELWIGVKQSLRPCQRGLLLNVDMTGNVVRPDGPLINIVSKYFGGRIPQTLSTGDIRGLGDVVKKMRVSLTHLPYPSSKVLTGVSSVSASAEKFTWSDAPGGSKDVTVADYFKQKYKITLRYPQLPCAQYGGGGRSAPSPSSSATTTSPKPYRRRGWGSRTKKR